MMFSVSHSQAKRFAEQIADEQLTRRSSNLVKGSVSEPFTISKSKLSPKRDASLHFSLRSSVKSLVGASSSSCKMSSNSLTGSSDRKLSRSQSPRPPTKRRTKKKITSSSSSGSLASMATSGNESEDGPVQSVPNRIMKSSLTSSTDTTTSSVGAAADEWLSNSQHRYQAATPEGSMNNGVDEFAEEQCPVINKRVMFSIPSEATLVTHRSKSWVTPTEDSVLDLDAVKCAKVLKTWNSVRQLQGYVDLLGGTVLIYMRSREVKTKEMLGFDEENSSDEVFHQLCSTLVEMIRDLVHVLEIQERPSDFGYDAPPTLWQVGQKWQRQRPDFDTDILPLFGRAVVASLWDILRADFGVEAQEAFKAFMQCASLAIYGRTD